MDITLQEIETCINKLKNNKASGLDNILNEHIKTTFPLFKNIYLKLFNIILNSGFYPDSWSTGMIMPVYKNKGSPLDASNYRPITLLSCLSKLFTAIINNRLQQYVEEFNIVHENQAGFRKGYSTIDNMFVLHSLINLLNLKKRKLFCAFIDLKQAFDKIPRTELWTKLMSNNINGKCFTLIKNMYGHVKSCISANNEHSDYFICDMGVRQGENLSPLLFSLYLNDLQDYFINSNNVNGINCNEYVQDDSINIYLKLFILLYADDTIIVCDTADDLQNALNEYSNYCVKWGLKVNTDKSKVLIFSKGKVNNYKFIYENEEIEIVNEYKYLGLFFNKSGSYLFAKKHIAKQGVKALYSLIKKAKYLNLPIDMQISLFDKLVKPVLMYGCEIWGFGNLEIINRVQLKFLKHVLNVKRSTPNYIVYGETGVFPISIDIHTRMISYWSKLIQEDNHKLSSTVYRLIYSQNINRNTRASNKHFPWSNCIKDILIKTGQSGIWNVQNGLNSKWLAASINQKLKDLFINEWYSLLSMSTNCCNYKLFKTQFGFENYLVNTPAKQLKSLINFRTRNNKLPVETGKWRKIPYENRFCTLCRSTTEIGDEYHYIFKCRELSILRKQYLKNKYLHKHNIYKLEKLINTKNQMEKRKLCLFINQILSKFK